MENPSHVLMLDDCDRYAWVPYFKVAEMKRFGWTVVEKEY